MKALQLRSKQATGGIKSTAGGRFSSSCVFMTFLLNCETDPQKYYNEKINPTGVHGGR